MDDEEYGWHTEIDNDGYAPKVITKGCSDLNYNKNILSWLKAMTKGDITRLVIDLFGYHSSLFLGGMTHFMINSKKSSTLVSKRKMGFECYSSSKSSLAFFIYCSVG